MRRLVALRLLTVLLVAGSGLGVGLFAQDAGTEPARQTREEASTRGPQAYVAQASLDLGTVKEGQDVKATFVIENRGLAELKILRAKPS